MDLEQQVDKLENKVTDIDVHKMSTSSFRYIFGGAMFIVLTLLTIVYAKTGINNDLYHRIDKNIAIIAEAVNVKLPRR
jgi:hypothetical protein